LIARKKGQTLTRPSSFPSPLRPDLLVREICGQNCRPRWNIVAKDGTKALFHDDGDWSAKAKIQAALGYALEMRNSGRVYPANDKLVPVEVRTFFISDRDPAKGQR
jgi:hypothetical protein